MTEHEGQLLVQKLFKVIAIDIVWSGNNAGNISTNNGKWQKVTNIISLSLLLPINFFYIQTVSKIKYYFIFA